MILRMKSHKIHIHDWLIQCSFGQECNFTYWSNEYHPFKLGKYSFFKEIYYAKLLHLWLKWVKNCATKLAKFCHSLGETELSKHWQKVPPNFGRIFWNLHLFSFLKPWVTYLYRLCIKVKNTKGIFFEKYDEGSVALHWHNENINVNPGLGGALALVPHQFRGACISTIMWYMNVILK